MQQLEIHEYANSLCKAKESYDFPKVTYDFVAEKENCHPDMWGVEKYIQGLLNSPDRVAIKNGLSNVLYWGYARHGIQSKRVYKFRDGVSDHHLDKFAEAVAGLQGLREPGLIRLKKIGMPEFSRMSFVSKIRMFLDPDNFPVLDTKLAENFSQYHIFPPLLNLTFKKKSEHGQQGDTQIRITRSNERTYDEWASWCRETARQVNSEFTSPCKDLRAVDVERAIYQLANSDQASAWELLSGPQEIT